MGVFENATNSKRFMPGFGFAISDFSGRHGLYFYGGAGRSGEQCRRLGSDLQQRPYRCAGGRGNPALSAAGAAGQAFRCKFNAAKPGNYPDY